MLMNCFFIWLGVAIVATSVQARSKTRGEEGSPSTNTVQKDVCHEIPQENSNHLQVVCRGVQSLQTGLSHYTKDQLEKITELNFTESHFTSLSLDNLVDLPSLHTLTFNQCLISDWKIPKSASVPNVTSIILNDSWNSHSLYSPYRNASLQFTSTMFNGLQSLEQLYLIKCFVSNMSAEIFGNIKTLKKLHVNNGSGIGCESEMEWLLDWATEGKAVVANDTVCFVPRDLGEGVGGILIMSPFYSLSGQSFFLIMGHRKETKRHCPKECNKCVLEGFNDGRSGRRQRNKPLINIDCDSAGLTELPDDIPPYSTRLSFKHNNITDINKLFTNENYRFVSTIRLEHNRISSMDGDLFYNFLKDRSHDLFINLNNNNFSTIPVKQMMRFYKEAQDSNDHNPLITLEFNPWDCNDCDFLPEFQELVYHQYYYRENGHNVYDDVRCAEGNNVFAGQMVVKVDVQTYCTPEVPLLKPLDIVSLSIGLIIILSVLNFAYNFYQYRKYSKLPWIITKVPCC